MNMFKDFKTPGSIVDLPLEEFKLRLDQSDITTVYTLRGVLSSVYTEVEGAKNFVLKALRSSDAQKKLNETLNDLYGALALIENRAVLVEERRKELEGDGFRVSPNLT